MAEERFEPTLDNLGPGPWTEVAEADYENGWERSEDSPLAWRLDHGTLEFRGFTSGVVATAPTVFTLPAKARPSADRVVAEHNYIFDPGDSPDEIASLITGVIVGADGGVRSSAVSPGNAPPAFNSFDGVTCPL